jgi:uncharacterized protein YrrD
MLILVRQMEGAMVEATDGKFGKVVDFLFDDSTWKVKSFVLDAGTWLNSRRVTIAPDLIRHKDWSDHRLMIAGLTRKQILESPGVETHVPVANGPRMDTATIMDWGLYWVQIIDHPWQVGDDPHVHNTQEVTGYHLRETDGHIGHVADFLIDDEAWQIKFIEADTRNWWPGKHVLISPERVLGIDGVNRVVNINLSRNALENSVVYHPSLGQSQTFESLTNVRM